MGRCIGKVDVGFENGKKVFNFIQGTLHDKNVQSNKNIQGVFVQDKHIIASVFENVLKWKLNTDKSKTAQRGK